MKHVLVIRLNLIGQNLMGQKKASSIDFMERILQKGRSSVSFIDPSGNQAHLKFSNRQGPTYLLLRNCNVNDIVPILKPNESVKLILLDDVNITSEQSFGMFQLRKLKVNFDYEKAFTVTSASPLQNSPQVHSIKSQS